MAPEHEQAIRRAYADFSQGDFDAAFERLDPDIEWRTPDRALFSGTYRGHDGVRKLLDSLVEVFGEFQWVPEQFFHNGDEIVVFVSITARGRASGATVDIRIAHLLRMRGDRIVRFEVFPEREQALAAAGLEP